MCEVVNIKRAELLKKGYENIRVKIPSASERGIIAIEIHEGNTIYQK